MRILLLAQFFPPDIGGEEQHVFNLANTLADRGHQVTVATQRMAGVLDEEVLPSGVRVHRFATMAMRLPDVYSTSRPHHPPVPDPLGRPRASPDRPAGRPDVIHAHNWTVNSALALRRRSARRPRFGLVLDTSRLQPGLRHETADARGLRSVTARRWHAACRVRPPTMADLVGSRNSGRHGGDAPMEGPAIDHVVSVSRAVADRQQHRRWPGQQRESRTSSLILLCCQPTSDPAAEPEATVIGALGRPCLTQDFLLFVGDLSPMRRVSGAAPRLRIAWFGTARR